MSISYNNRMKECIGLSFSDKQVFNLSLITNELTRLSGVKIDCPAILPIAYVDSNSNEIIKKLQCSFSNAEISFHTLTQYNSKCYLTIKCNQLSDIFQLIKDTCTYATFFTQKKFTIKLLLNNNFVCDNSVKELSKCINIYNKPSVVKEFIIIK